MNIRMKLFAGISAILLLLGAQVAVIYTFLQRNHELASGSVARDFEQSVHIAHIAIEGQKLRRFEKEFFIYVTNEERRNKYIGEWTESFDKLGLMLDEIQTSGDDAWSAQDKSLVGDWRRSYERYGDEFKQVIASVQSGEITTTEDANTAIKVGKNAFRVLLNGATEGGEIKYGAALLTMNQLANNSSLMRIVVLSVCAANVLIALFMLLVIPRSITRPIAALSEAASRMSKGELNQPVPPAKVSEFTELSQTLERLRVSQKTLIDRVKSTSARQKRSAAA